MPAFNLAADGIRIDPQPPFWDSPYFTRSKERLTLHSELLANSCCGGRNFARFVIFARTVNFANYNGGTGAYTVGPGYQWVRTSVRGTVDA
jgi:hypothetical protein